MMDVEKFIKERSRMCEYYEEKCSNCPAKEIGCLVTLKSIRELNDIVEKWSEENPPRTRQSEFLKQFTKANVDENGVLRICPNYIDSTVKCYAYEKHCEDCRKEYWSEAVE